MQEQIEHQQQEKEKEREALEQEIATLKQEKQEHVEVKRQGG